MTAFDPSVNATRVVRLGGAVGSSSSTDVIIGLGRDGALASVDVDWPRKERVTEHYSLPNLRDRLVCIERQRGAVPCAGGR